MKKKNWRYSEKKVIKKNKKRADFDINMLRNKVIQYIYIYIYYDKRI